MGLGRQGTPPRWGDRPLLFVYVWMIAERNCSIVKSSARA
jgi:hypothetical protein